MNSIKTTWDSTLNPITPKTTWDKIMAYPPPKTPVELRPEFFNLNGVIQTIEPVLIWKVSPTNFWQTGFRPYGESVKLNGAWWKIEKFSTKSLMNMKKFELDMQATFFDSPPTFTFSQIMKKRTLNLQRAMDEAIQSGISREKIIELLDQRIIADVMEL